MHFQQKVMIKKNFKLNYNLEEIKEISVLVGLSNGESCDASTCTLNGVG